MKTKGKRWLLALFAGLCMVWIALPASAGDKKTLEAKAAVVNGTVITRGAFDRELRGVKQQYSSTGRPLTDTQLLQLRKNVLENLINLELLYQEAQKKGFKIEQAELDKQLGALKKRFANEDQFKKTLEQMGFTEEGLRSQIQKVVTVQGFVETQVVQDIVISEKEIRSYYDSHPESFRQPEQVKASHILIKVEAEAEKEKKAEALKKLKKIQERVKKGEDFSALAKEFSQGPSSARGGDLGYFGRGQMVKPFEEAAFALEPGQTSDIVETKFGYHLIRCVDKKPKGKIPYAEIKEKLGGYLRKEKIRERVNTYTEQLKKKARIERPLIENQ